MLKRAMRTVAGLIEKGRRALRRVTNPYALGWGNITLGVVALAATLTTAFLAR